MIAKEEDFKKALEQKVIVTQYPEKMVNKPIFTESNHSYISPVTGLKYTSVTTLIHQYAPKFDAHTIAIKYVAKRTERKLIEDLLAKYVISKDSLLESFKDIGHVETVKRLWIKENDRSCIQGTKYHKEKENIDLATIKVGQVPVDIEDLYLLPDGTYLELLIWNNELGIAGQADKVIIETIGKDRWVQILDYKTNKEIKNYNYLDKRNGTPVINEYLLAPVNYLCHCNYNLYQLQLNLYGWLLTQFGFKIKGGEIIHVTDNDKIYPLNNHQNDIEAIIKDYTDGTKRNH